MLKSDVDEGQWVRFLTTDTKHQFDGFVVKKRDTYARVAIPSLHATRSIPYKNLISDEQLKLDEQQVDDLIEIALMFHDKEWFDDLYNFKEVLSTWK